MSLLSSPAEQLFTFLDPPCSPYARAAIELHCAGLNVIPQPYGQTQGFPESPYIRLPLGRFAAIFAGLVNLAVIPGRTSGNLFVIDCESPEAFRHHWEAAQARGLAPWAAETPRGGQLYFLCAEGEVKNIIPGRMSDAEVHGEGTGTILCPPSCHPPGRFYTWLERPGDRPPTVAAHQINWLTTPDGRPIKLQVRKPAQKRPALNLPTPLRADPRVAWLSYATRTYLEPSDDVPEANCTDRLFAAACDLHGAGFDRWEAETWLTPTAAQSGLPPDEIEAALDRAYSQPRTPARSRPYPSLADLEAYALDLYRGKHLTASACKLALALIERARNDSDGSGSFRASQRELADLARLSRKTVQSTLRTLQRLEPPFIERAGPTAGSGAQRFRFPAAVRQRAREMYKSSPLDTSVSLIGLLLHTTTRPGTDAAERGAANVNGIRVYHHMRELGRPTTVQALVADLGLSASQVRYALKKLEPLIERPGHGLWYAPPVGPVEAVLDDYVAKPAGKLGRGAQRADAFDRERGIAAARAVLVYRWLNDPFYPEYEGPCPHCGERVGALGLHYCPHCGAVLRPAAEASPFTDLLVPLQPLLSVLQTRLGTPP